MNRPHLPANLDDPLDRALSSFYKSQLPAQWPAVPIPAEARRETRRHSWRNRLTLGASIAAMLALGIGLSYTPNVPSSPSESNGFFGTGTAGPGKLNKHIQKVDLKP